MSIINQVMKDLDKRQSSPLAGFNQQHSGRLNQKSKLLMLAGSVFGLIPLTVVWLNTTSPTQTEAIPSLTQIINENMSQFPASAGVEVEAKAKATTLTSKTGDIAPVEKTSNISEVQATTSLVPERKLYTVKAGDSLSKIFANLDLSAKELYYVMNSGPQAKQLTQLQPGQNIHFIFSEQNELKQLFFEKTRKYPALIIFKADSKQYIATVMSEEKEPDAKTDDDATVVSQPAATEQPKLKPVQTQPQSAALPVTEAEPVKLASPTIVALKTVAKKNRQPPYEAALKAIEQEQTNHAVNLLQALLVNKPQHQKARVLLASLQLKVGQRAQAIQLLEAGLAYPHNVDLTQLLANSYLASQQLPKAIEVLQNALKTQHDEALSALLAASFQRTEQHQQAITYYQTALKGKPNQPKWWVGLGISLEATAQQQAAENAYQRAMQLGLSPQLKSYALKRLSHISRT